MSAIDPESIKRIAELILPHLSAEEREHCSSNAALLDQEVAAGRLKIENDVIAWNRRETQAHMNLQAWLAKLPEGHQEWQSSDLAKALNISNPTSEDYRLLSKLMSEAGWRSRKNAKGTVYFTGEPENKALVQTPKPRGEYPWILEPVQLGSKWDSPEHDGPSLVEDLGRIFQAIPDQTRGAFQDSKKMSIYLPAQAHTKVSCYPVTPAASDSVLQFFCKSWGIPMENIHKVWALSAESSGGNHDNFPVLLKDRAIVEYRDDDGKLLAHLVVEWAD